MSRHSKTVTYTPGFPKEIKSLRLIAGEAEPRLTFGLWALLAQKRVRLTWGDVDVLSGQALQFAYAREAARANDLAVVPPLQLLSRALGVIWTEITLSSAVKAYEIATEWLEDGALCLARFKRPLLFFGYERTHFEPNIKLLRIEHLLPEQDLSRSDCDKFEWKLQLDDQNSLLRINYVEQPEPDWMELLPQVVRRAIANWRHESIDGVEIGLAAYQAFAADLRDPKVEFATSESPSWMGPVLLRQAMSRLHIQSFLDRIAPRYGGKPRQILNKASSGFGQSAVAWREFRTHLGRVYEKEEQGKSFRGPDAHVHQWRDMGRREQAARQVDQAALWEGRAIAELAKLLGT